MPRRSDASIRHHISMCFAIEVSADRPPAVLDHLLTLAREREQFCHGAHDLFGLNRCLGNQALIQQARGQHQDALALLKQLEMLSRRLDDAEGLAFALIHQAVLLHSFLNQPAESLAFAEWGKALAEANRLTKLANLGAQLLAQIRSEHS